MHPSPTPPRFATLLLLTALLAAACAPAAVGDTATVRPYRLPPLESTERYVLAVYDIEAEPTRVDVTLLPARERDARLFTDLGRGIGDIVTRELFELGRFNLVERRNLQAVLDEQDLGRTGRFDAATVADVGRLVGAELILVGAVTELSIDRTSAVVPGFLGGATVTTARVAIELRFVDVATGRILGIGSGEGRASDAEVTIDGLQQALRLLRVGTVRQSIVAVALRNAIRDAVEAAALGLPPRR